MKSIRPKLNMAIGNNMFSEIPISLDLMLHACVILDEPIKQSLRVISTDYN